MQFCSTFLSGIGGGWVITLLVNYTGCVSIRGELGVNLVCW